MTLDRFRLSGIEPQPQGEARIEVTFNIDANSIVHVSALDLQTGNECDVAISSVGGLSRGDVERMVEEARTHAEQDRIEREEVEIGIRAESMIAAAEQAINDAAEVEKSQVEKEIDQVGRGILAVRESMARGDSSAIKEATKQLEELIRTLDRHVKEEKRASHFHKSVAGLRVQG